MTDKDGFGARLAFAQEAGLPDVTGAVVLQPEPGADLSAFGAARVVHPLKTVHDAFAAEGYAVSPEPEDQADVVAVCLPRARAEAKAMIADAVSRAGRLVIVDGQKDSGAAAMLKALRARVAIDGVVSKAHGKLFWFAPSGDFSDWASGPHLTEGGFWTAPGVFSADGVDEGSALLAEALPELKGQVADLGAGWGFLAAHILTQAAVETVYLVEAHHMALRCAEHNVTDPRARFFWADARRWETPAYLDWVVMNPPFHDGRKASPALGQAFIAAAAGMLKPKGRMLMVANRHLPYEEAVDRHFRKWVDLGGNQRFKLVLGEAPRRG